MTMGRHHKKLSMVELLLGMGLAACIIVIAVLAVLLIVLKRPESTALPISTSSPSPSSSPYATKIQQNVDDQTRIGNSIRQAISTSNIRTNLYKLTKQVHTAGSAAQLDTMMSVKQHYQAIGLDAHQYDYYPLLDYPDYDNPNTVQYQVTNSNSWQMISNGTAQPVGPPEAVKEQESDPKAKVLWNAYAKPGSATGTIVYANTGTAQDFAYLKSLGVNVNGTIALVRYGSVWRGEKVYQATLNGAVGCIIYSDPQQYAPPNGSNVFPNSMYMPSTSAQRGSLSQVNGDPLTPLYPAVNYTYPTETEQSLRSALILPNIPVLPIGYGAAQQIFARMNGLIAPNNFTGGIGVQYRLNDSSGVYRIVVNQATRIANIRNAVGYLRGSDEPDRIVMLSNHVDAWTYGAHDPNSGTATIMEISRAMMQVVNETGWRPRRTIAFVSFDSEEFGLDGSTELAEEYLKVFEDRGVALINVDLLFNNITLAALGVPLLYRSLVRAAQKVPNPNRDELALNRTTVYDSWWHYYNLPGLVLVPGTPGFGLPGSESDHAAYIGYVGVPVCMIVYTCPYTVPREQCFPLYHTMLEIPWAADNIWDKQYYTMQALGAVWIEMARDLADSIVIPFNVTDYAVFLTNGWNVVSDQLLSQGAGMLIPTLPAIVNSIKDAIQRFMSQAIVVQDLVDQAYSGNAAFTVKQVEMLNRRLNKLERAFINPRGIYAGRQDARHVVFATSLENSYEGVIFAGVVDPIMRAVRALGSNDLQQMNQQILQAKLSLSELQYAIESAILVLQLDGFYDYD